MSYSKDLAKTTIAMCVDYINDTITLVTFISNLRVFADFLEEYQEEVEHEEE